MWWSSSLAACVVVLLALGVPAVGTRSPETMVLAAPTPFSSLGGAGLEFTDVAKGGDVIAALDALPALLAAHGAAAEALAPGADIHAATAQQLAAQREWIDLGLELSAAQAATPLPIRSTVMHILAAQTRPAPGVPLPPMPSFASVPEALGALFAWDGVAIDPEVGAAIASYEALPPDTAEAVVDVVEAHLFMSAATRLAFRHPAHGYAFDDGLLLDARDAMADAVLSAGPLLRAASGPEDIIVCDTLILSVQDEDSIYDCDARLILDLGGDDWYQNNAGGTILDGESALMVDPDGRDKYACFRHIDALTGSGHNGTGALFDLDENDLSESDKPLRAAIDGAAINGTGLLVDTVGDDTRRPKSNGGAIAGSGMDGIGALIDLDGNDSSNVLLRGDGAIGGSAIRGRGLYVDPRGFDSYGPTIWGNGSANGGAIDGEAVLLDLDGDVPVDWTSDPFEPHLVTINATGIANGAALRGSGLLFDARGNDSYNVRIGGYAVANGGALLGMGALIDLEGVGEYFLVGPGDPFTGLPFAATAQTDGIANGAARGVPRPGDAATDRPGALGFLFSGGQGATYEANNLSSGAGYGYGAGLLVDAAGSDVLDAKGSNALGLGAARYGGLGILADQGAGAARLFGGEGIAFASQGVGLVARGGPADARSYAVSDGLRAYDAEGAGLAILADAGQPAFFGSFPDPECRTAALGTPIAVDDVVVRLCKPDPEEHVPILDPSTGAAMGPAAKPSMPCRELVVGPADCGQLADDELGPEAAEWLESDEIDRTTSGATRLFAFQTPDGPQASMTHQVNFADRLCNAGCSQL